LKHPNQPKTPMAEIDQYDFDLPKDLIAQHPLANRSDSRLMVIDRQRQSIEHFHVRDLPEILAPSDTLVLNDTRVIPARLVGRRTETSGKFQGLFLDADEHGVWRLLCKTRGKLRPGERVILQDREAREKMHLHMLVKFEDGSWAARPESGEPPLAVLERVGHIPLPHYIRGGEMVDADRESYQTVFAAEPGAVAAPTAGLHFTAPLLKEIQTKGVNLCRVTLHVGIGTFKPIAVDRLEEHTMHAEWGSLSERTVEVLTERKAAGGRTIAVGTTAVRVLEAAAADGTLRPFEGETDLFIRPPYEFKAVDCLMTNFHLPRSTLLVLVRTFGGEELIKRAYAEAVEQQYRFFSYGDAMLIV